MKQLFIKHKELSPAVKASACFVICNLIQKGISLLAIPVYTRLLSTSEYGVYSVYISWVNIALIIGTLNLSAGIFNNGMLKYENNRDCFISNLQGLSTITSLVLIVICVAFHTKISSLVGMKTALLFILLAQVLFTPAMNYWMVRQRFEFKYKPVVVVSLFIAILTPILSVLLIYVVPDKSLGIILGYAGIQICVGSFFFLRNQVKGKSFFNKEIWKYALAFNVPLLPHYLAYIVLGQADRVMINSICGPSDAGIYSLAYQIAIVINLFTNAIDASFTPWTYQMLRDKNNKRISAINNNLIFAFCVVMVGMMLIVPEVLSFVAPPEYQEARWVMPPVIFGCYFQFLAGAFMRVEFYHEKKYIIMVSSTVTALINIVLNALFIPRYGFIAAAYTTANCYCMYAFLHYIAMQRICKINNYDTSPYSGKTIMLFSGVSCILTLFLMYLYNFSLTRYFILTVILICCVIFRTKLIKLFNEIRDRQ